MDLNSPAALLLALRESGLWTPEQLREGETFAASAPSGTPALAESFQKIGPFTAYQFRKVRVNRIVDLLIGPYLVMDKIGEGGMGKVYRAVQARIGRSVALKVVRPHLMQNKMVLKRYKREAAAAAAMNHPNIVALLDADESAGRYYLAMEYVEGSDLARLVKDNGALPFQEACEYVRQSALGLQHAHECGLIHRDIKPSNILVSGERALPGTDGKANVKILDMGLVRSLSDDDDVSRTELTRDGTVVGTPDYMSPEQAKNSSTVDGRADIYSLGCTLYYLLVGKPPFTEGTSIDKLLRHQLDPPPDISKLRRELPPGLVAVVNRSLKKKPEDRYATATAFAQALLPYTPAGENDLLLSPVGDIKSRSMGYSGLPASLASPEAATPPPATNANDDRLIVTATIVAPVKPKPRVTKPAKPIPKPTLRADANPESGSLPGMSTRPNTPSTMTRTPRKTVLTPISKVRKRTDGRAIWVITALVVCLGVAVGLAVLAMSGSITKPSDKPITVNSGSGSTKPTTTDPITAVNPNSVPVAVYLPEGTTATLVVYPKPYFEKARFEIQPKAAAALARITNTYKFDPRKYDRIVLGFTDALSDQFTAVGEGSSISTEWTTSLKKSIRKQGKDTREIDLNIPFMLRPENPFFGGLRQTDTPHHGVVLGTKAYAIGTQFASINSIARRFPDLKNAPGLDSLFLAALPLSTDSSPPFLTFIAGPGWAPPHGKKLGEDKVKLATVKVTLGEEGFEVELTITGIDKSTVKDYGSLFLATTLRDKLPKAKPFLDDVIVGDPEWDMLPGGLVRMKHTGRWPYDSAAEWLEAFLPSVKE